MRRKQLLTVLVSLMVTALASATGLAADAHGNYCPPVGVCASDCEATTVVDKCRDYAAEGCFTLGAECWESSTGQYPECNSAGYAKVLCFYSEDEPPPPPWP